METASEWSKNFEQRWDEYVLEKTTDELLSERESLLDDFRDYAEIGQGISTKETIRMNRIEKELTRRGVRFW
jgi:predicted nucleic acid-binding OB-fold protein